MAEVMSMGELDGLEAVLAAAAGQSDWADEALCAQADPEAFFPEKGGSTREAKRVCMRCAVRPQCLQWALDTHERFGIWGGYSERERRCLLLERQAAAAEAATEAA